MGMVIGPVLRRAEGYGYDIWTAGEGVTRGYPYRRIEDAHYARNAEIRRLPGGRARAAIVCETLDEFLAKSTGYEMLAAARLGLRGGDGLPSEARLIGIGELKMADRTV